MRVCSQCGAENRETVLECRMCMHPLTMVIPEGVPKANQPPEFVSTIIEHSHRPTQVMCQRCAAPNEAAFNFCQACGSRLVNDDPMQEAKTVIAGVIPQKPSKDDAEAHQKMPASGATRQCSTCMNEVSAGSRFCNFCGTPLATDQPVAVAPVKALPTFRLRLITDGEESDETYQLGNTTVIGRVQGDIHFPYDDYMSSRHASIMRRGDRFFLKDDGSRNGTLIKIDGEEELKPGSVFMVGRQLFKFEVDE